jgi:hypothetical protein
LSEIFSVQEEFIDILSADFFIQNAIFFRILNEISLADFTKILQRKILLKTTPPSPHSGSRVAACRLADRRMDGRDETNRRFPQLCEKQFKMEYTEVLKGEP